MNWEINWQIIATIVAFIAASNAILLFSVKYILDRAWREGAIRIKELYGLHYAEEKARIEFHDKANVRIDEMQNRVMDILTNMPHDYLCREDWIRFANKQDAKLDATISMMHKISEELHVLSSRTGN